MGFFADALAVDVDSRVQAQWARCTAIVHQAPANEIDVAAANMVGLLKSLTEDRDRLEQMAVWLNEESQKIAEIDQFLPEVGGRAILRRIAASSREWAPKYAALAIPEDHLLAAALRAWIRPFNDSVRAAHRALLDTAETFERRIAEEEAEDAAADAWATSRPSRDPVESTVSLADFIAGDEEVKAILGVK